MKMLRSQPNDAACRRCIDTLQMYIASQLTGEDYLSRFADVATHLDSCPDCAEIYARVYELELAEMTDQLIEPEYIPEPDLGFLNPQPVPSVPDLLKQAVRQWADGLSLQLTAELQKWLHPLPAAQLRQSPTTQDRFSELLLKLPPERMPDWDLPISMTAFRDAQNPETCLVEVVVEPPGRSWPHLAGSRVTLQMDEEEKTAETDHNGLASFTAVSVAALPTLNISVLYD